MFLRSPEPGLAAPWSFAWDIGHCLGNMANHLPRAWCVAGYTLVTPCKVPVSIVTAAPTAPIVLFSSGSFLALGAVLACVALAPTVAHFEKQPLRLRRLAAVVPFKARYCPLPPSVPANAGHPQKGSRPGATLPEVSVRRRLKRNRGGRGQGPATQL